jgi:hypothetical protein
MDPLDLKKLSATSMREGEFTEGICGCDDTLGRGGGGVVEIGGWNLKKCSEVEFPTT